MPEWSHRCRSLPGIIELSLGRSCGLASGSGRRGSIVFMNETRLRDSQDDNAGKVNQVLLCLSAHSHRTVPGGKMRAKLRGRLSEDALKHPVKLSERLEADIIGNRTDPPIGIQKSRLGIFQTNAR